MASERRPAPNQALDLLQTLLEAPPLPSSGIRLSPKQTPDHALTQSSAGEAAPVHLQTWLDTPGAPSYERRPPIILRSVDTLHSTTAVHSAYSTWFDAVLQRSSQALAIGAVVMLGYWFIRVPLNNWLHPLPVPLARASSLRASPTAIRSTPTKPANLKVNAAPDIAQSPRQNNRTALPLHVSAVPIITSGAAQAATPSITQPSPTAAQLLSPTLTVEATPTDLPQPTASPLPPSPTMELMWPTITPVQLGVVTKPSPAPVERKIVAAQPAGPNQPRSASSVPTRMIIPALGLDIAVKEVFIVNNQWEIAKYAAGYMNGSGLPGRPGNLAINGHAGLYGAVFANLSALNPGDEIFVDAAGTRYRYILRTASAVWPNQTEVLDSTETPTMTLITCTNWDLQRLVAQADFVDSGPVPDA